MPQSSLRGKRAPVPGGTRGPGAEAEGDGWGEGQVSLGPDVSMHFNNLINSDVAAETREKGTGSSG